MISVVGLLLKLCSIHFLFLSSPVDTEKSKVNFSVSNFKINSVDGHFTGLEGTVELNPQDLANAQIDVCLKASTIKTGIEKRDEHLRSEDFFYVKAFPEICFRSTDITASGDGYIARGTLSMRGVQKTVEVVLSKTGSQITGRCTVKRLDFGVGEETSTFTVGNEVQVEVICVLQK